ncbi:hypothetical protein ZIOFF_075919 [Zingiber officinale]|uniref:Luc7-like protein 3 n=1 Tax=Zingiber officinale TaxID=94328 RepID=A0A8J5C4D4_ZINOF|nr:hypothetical protein ZIOFF_075919 [Zingiber officinale]
MDAQRALLDDLMGAARNLTDEQKKKYKEVLWTIRSFFLGVCPKIHDKKLKESFEKSPRHDAYVLRFEADLAKFCEKLVADLDRKVKRGRKRLEQEVDATPLPVPNEKPEQLSVLEEKIKKLLEQIETLGESGKIDEAEALMRKVELLNAEKTTLAQQSAAAKAILPQEKKMALCEICGSFLVANDVVDRTQTHVTGKQHIGYGMIRDFLSEFKAAKEKGREEEKLAREKGAEEQRKREKDHGSRVRESHVGGRERSREHDRKRDRYTDRGYERERSRDLSGQASRAGGLDRRHDYRRNGRESNRDRYQNRSGARSRSRSPSRHGY